jgi:hypothetical protein
MRNKMVSKTTQKAKRTQKPSDEILALKQRIINITPQLVGTWINDICQAFPEHDTEEGRRRLKNIKMLLITDEEITVRLEKYVKEKERFISELKTATN